MILARQLGVSGGGEAKLPCTYLPSIFPPHNPECQELGLFDPICHDTLTAPWFASLERAEECVHWGCATGRKRLLGCQG